MTRRFSLITLFVAFAALSFATPPVEEGKSIFAARCAACHNINKDLTGPALAGVDQRRSMEWIVNFVHSPQSMIQAGDKDAVALFNKYNNIAMPDHKDLSEGQIKNLVDYIKSEAKAAPANEAPFAVPAKLRPAYKPLSADNWGFFTAYAGLVALLVGVMLFAVQLKQYERSLSGGDTEV